MPPNYPVAIDPAVAPALTDDCALRSQHFSSLLLLLLLLLLL